MAQAPELGDLSHQERAPSPDVPQGPEPCGRCTKAGQAADCLYIDEPSNAVPRSSGVIIEGNNENNARSSQPSGPSNDLLTRLEHQDRRVKELEAALARITNPSSTTVHYLANSKLPLTPSSVNGAATIEPPSQAKVPGTDTTLLRGKSFKTQFYGATHVGALVAHVPELARFTKETFETFPSFLRIRQDMKALEKRSADAETKSTMTGDDDLRALLAPMGETDTLVQLYLDYYDPIYHIVHLPTFQQDYSDMWLDPSTARPHVIALVLIMTACSQLLSPSTAPWMYTGNSSTARERATGVLRQVENWIQRQSEKHVTIMDFQIRFLLILAKRIAIRKVKRQWSEASRFLHFCMSAGLHRDPDCLRKPTSALDKEMRRRIWSAAVEFELQMAFERGMVPSPWPLQSDCSPPSNISDDDFAPSVTTKPLSSPIRDWTSSSWLALSSDSLMLRHSLNTALNSIHQPLSFNEGKRYTEELEAHLKALPFWTGTTSEGPRALLELSLRQYILAIHSCLLRQSESQTERDLSCLTVLENSKRIVDIFKRLAANKNHSLRLLREDLVRAACSMSHASSVLDSNAATSRSVMFQVLDANSIQLMEDVVERLTDNIGRYGREQRQLWIVLAADGFIKTRRNPEDKLRYMQEAYDMITKPYYRILAGQKDTPASVGRPDVLAQKYGERGFTECSPGANQNVSGSATEQTPAIADGLVDDPPLLDFEALAAWTFEDWPFSPGTFSGFENEV